MSWTGVITNAGKTALESAIAQGVALNINAVQTGTGYVAAENMRAATALQSQAGAGILREMKKVSGGVNIRVSVEPGESAFTMKELGIFGKVGSGSNVLVALYQNTAGIDVPAAASFPDFLYTLNAVWDIANDEDLEITVDPTAFATATDTVLYTTLSRGRKAETTVGTGSIAFGNDVEAIGDYSQAFGNGTKARANNSTAHGLNNQVAGISGHAEGEGTHVGLLAQGGHSEGYQTEVSGQYSHAEGYKSLATGPKCHAEGEQTTASGSACHSEGNNTIASGTYNHSEGYFTKASGYACHAEGYGGEASGYYSHAAGVYTTASHKSQSVFGEYNVADPSNVPGSQRGTYAEIVGNGAGSGSKSNARALDWEGNEYLKGNLYVKCKYNSTDGLIVPAYKKLKTFDADQGVYSPFSLASGTVAKIIMESYDGEAYGEWMVKKYNSGVNVFIAVHKLFGNGPLSVTVNQETFSESTLYINKTDVTTNSVDVYALIFDGNITPK